MKKAFPRMLPPLPSEFTARVRQAAIAAQSTDRRLRECDMDFVHVVAAQAGPQMPKARERFMRIARKLGLS